MSGDGLLTMWVIGWVVVALIGWRDELSDLYADVWQGIRNVVRR